ncbi:malonate-semialdehyde dehydrogenase (acetylating) / methylmalonate-semialdehyde dehydrogenase, partial [Geosmithia morbida]
MCGPSPANVRGLDRRHDKAEVRIPVARCHSTQAFISRVPESTAAEVRSAVEAASAAQMTWRDMPMGKTLADADAEFERGIDAVETACSVANDSGGVHHLHQAADIYTINQPLGVCIAICPFNFPFMIPLWSTPYALLAGNTMVLKPSELAPSASQILAECFLGAGFPPGVFNVVHGKMRVVNSLLSEPAVRAVNFVGTEIAGERVYEHAQATRKRIQAECNAKNHGVIVGDASKAKTLYAIVGSAFGAAGQRCMSLSVVIFVGETRAWVDELVGLAASLVVGCGLDPLVEVGPLITPAAKARVEDMIAGAVEEGASVALDGRGLDVPDYPEGNFVGPTVLTGVKPHMSCYQEEIFGPVLCCMEVDTLDEAIDLVNENKYGNGCTLFTKNPATAQIFQRSVNVGQVGINVPILAPSGPVARTGNKDSFLG